MEFPIDDICNAVERSNNLKKKTRIVEGSRTRVEPDEAELLLKSGELILCIVGCGIDQMRKVSYINHLIILSIPQIDHDN
jgi:hypothetical protein